MYYAPPATEEARMATAVPIPQAELDDPDVLPDDELVALLDGAPWRRFVVVGDSVAKGVAEESPGYRSLRWGARVAAVLARVNPGAVYENLGTREQRAAEIRDTQLARALALEPDLVAYVGGGNDMLVEHFDVEPVAATIDETIAALAASGATVVTYSMMDLPSAFPGLEALGGRLRALNEAVAGIAARHGAVHVDLHSLPCCSDPALYSSDLMHGSMRAQAIVATVTVRRLAERIRGAAR
jgi:lysophospholipase L1-like esterase